MEKVAQKLTAYVIEKGVISKTEKDIYEYGFCLAAEFGVFALSCVVIAWIFHMPFEGILFFVTFAPLRFYAGGLHLKSFQGCFLLSCVTFAGTLVSINFIKLPTMLLFCLLIILEGVVYGLYPVKHVNRAVDEDEIGYFRKKLKKYLGLDFCIGIICVLLQWEKCLTEIVLILGIVTLTMILGKCDYYFCTEDKRRGLYK